MIESDKSIRQDAAVWYAECIRRGSDKKHNAYQMIFAPKAGGGLLHLLPGSERRGIKRRVKKEMKKEKAIASKRISGPFE